MICCGLAPIKNVALGKEFYVCTECKSEVGVSENETKDEFSGVDLANAWDLASTVTIPAIGQNSPATSGGFMVDDYGICLDPDCGPCNKLKGNK